MGYAHRCGTTVARRWVLLILLGLVCLAALPAGAAAGMGRRGVPASTSRDLSNPAQLQAFADAFFQSQMAERHIPGAVFVLVKGDQVVLARGYGYADLARQTPIDPASTVFRVQSISKLFTATGLMQLAEAGRLQLDADVNTYLRRIQLPATFARPITPAHLLTHTAGLDLIATGVSAATPEQQEALGAYLAHALPARVMPPGEVYSYNNHGMALAGLLIEEIAGQPFDQYMADHILQPLEMHQSSFRLPLELADQLATEYTYSPNGGYQPVAFDYLQMLPAGGLNTTGIDMAHFMMAHLQAGRYQGQHILREQTVAEMHRQHFTAHPRLPGMAYGFHEYFQNGLRMLVHGGSWAGSASQLVLIPEQQIGFFLSYTRSDASLRDDFTRQLLDAFFPASASASPTAGSGASQAHSAQLVGSYRSISFTRSDLFKIGALLNEYAVIAEGDGTFQLQAPTTQEPSRWAEIEPLLFQRLTPGQGMESDLAAFVEAGEDARLAIGTGQMLIRLRWYERRAVQLALIGALLLLFISGLLAPLGSALRRRIRPQPAPRPAARRWVEWAMVAYSALALSLLIGLVVSMLTINPNLFNVGLPLPIRLLLLIPWLLLPLALCLVVLAALGWVRRTGSLLQRLHASAVALAALTLFPFLLFWNLLIWPLD